MLFPPAVVVEIKALACELPRNLGVPLSHFCMEELRREAVSRGIVAEISGTTLWRWFTEDAIRPWRHRSWIFPLGQITKEPKNETSIRTIALPPFIAALLRQYKAYQAEQKLKLGDLWQGSDRLFVTWDGRPAHPEWSSQWFAKFVKKYGLAHLNFHGLRHYGESSVM